MMSGHCVKKAFNNVAHVTFMSSKRSEEERQDVKVDLIGDGMALLPVITFPRSKHKGDVSIKLLQCR